MSLIKEAKEMLKKAKKDIAEEGIAKEARIAEEARMAALDKKLNEGIESLLDKFRVTNKELSKIKDEYDRYAKSVMWESLKIEFFLKKKTISRLTPEQESLMKTAHTICINDKYMDYMNDLRSLYLC